MATKRVSQKEIAVSAAGPAAAPATRRKSPNTRRTRVAAPAAEPDPAAQTSAAQPSRDQIALLAYSYWEARGFQGGSPDEDWLRAEQELSTRAVAATA
jgi:hypothetical protein